MIKGRRVKRSAVLDIDSFGTIESISIFSPQNTCEQTIEELPKKALDQDFRKILHENALMARASTVNRRKIIDRVDRGARTGNHIVYLMFNHVDALLYVGITQNGMRRMVQHEKDKDWFNQVARIDIERYAELIYAARREKKLIEKYAPLYNVTYNLGRQVP
jgi:predicted GIY-YIG superfamily endonuclease